MKVCMPKWVAIQGPLVQYELNKPWIGLTRSTSRLNST